MSEISEMWAHTFPMVRSGGLFILIMGLGVLLGGMVPKRRMLLLALGGGAATVAIILFANVLALGIPTPLQLWSLFLAILLEAVLVRIVVARYRSAGERTFLLGILFVVGLHFLPMAVAFGPLCAVLGLLAIVNASVGLWMRPDMSLTRFWIVDGGLKMVFGALMLAARGIP